MGYSQSSKILSNHLAGGTLQSGEEISVRVDQVLMQDATGTMACLQFEAIGLSRIKIDRATIYVDHNMLQQGFENADDHRYLQSVAAHYGIHFSRPGNGICHQVQLERVSVPGGILLGSDSHTPTSGGIGMLSIGVGGLDIAAAMAGDPFTFTCPKIVQVELSGKRGPWITAKDIILEMLRRLTVKGGVGKIFEYTGDGVSDLSVPERATITNMGAELGATSSIFPSDEITKAYLKAEGREQSWLPLGPDPDAHYDERIRIDLHELEPLIALPHSPDCVKRVSEVAGLPVDQVAIGSCTNSSYHDLMTVAALLKGKRIASGVSLGVSPGSRQVLEMIAQSGGLADLISSGARILESACGPCIGMGFAPPSGGVSVRSFNRNFPGRSGTKDARVYLASPEVCAATALAGVIADPRALGKPPTVTPPQQFFIDDGLIIAPPSQGNSIEVLRGPNIAPCPTTTLLPPSFTGEVLIKVGDDITTDHILPGGAAVLPLRSNIPRISEYVFSGIDPAFATRATSLEKTGRGGIIVGGENYGQGSSREHAAIAPMYLGVKIVIAKSFARIHRANLINFGILPIIFADGTAYDHLAQGDELVFADLRDTLLRKETIEAKQKRDIVFTFRHDLSPRELQLVMAGGKLSAIRERSGKIH